MVTVGYCRSFSLHIMLISVVVYWRQRALALQKVSQVLADWVYLFSNETCLQDS